MDNLQPGKFESKNITLGIHFLIIINNNSDMKTKTMVNNFQKCLNENKLCEN
jgi:hypothetical protein